MENNGSQNLGGEKPLATGEGIFSPEVGEMENKTGVEREIYGVTQDMERDLGATALEGLEEMSNLPLPEEEPSEEALRVVREGGDLQGETEVDQRTERGVREIVESAEKSTKETEGHPADTEAAYKQKRRELLGMLGHYGMGGAE